MPLTNTVRPPLTRPLVVPVTNSPDSSACSSDSHEARRLAVSRDSTGVAVAVFDDTNGHRDEVTHLDFDFALVVFELFNWHIGFGFEASVHDHKVLIDGNHFGSDYFARTHFGALQGFFKQGGKRFGHVFPWSQGQVSGSTIAARF